MWIFRRINTLWQNVLNICHYDTCASESRPERVRLCVHTTEPTGPVPEPFHCDHIARWSARSGTTGRSGTGVNTGARLRSGTVPVPKLWCEHGLRVVESTTVTHSSADWWDLLLPLAQKFSAVGFEPGQDSPLASSKTT